MTSSHQPTSTAAPPKPLGISHLPQNDAVDSQSSGRYEWSARVTVDEHALDGSFSVLIFLGPIPNNPEEWYPSPSYVGSISAYVSSVGSYGRPQDRAESIIQGVVHLNRTIAAQSGLNSSSPRVVIPYLTENLGWRVEKADGTEVPVENVRSLEIVVIGTPLTLIPGEDFPIPGEMREYHSVTAGRQGGWIPSN